MTTKARINLGYPRRVSRGVAVIHDGDWLAPTLYGMYHNMGRDLLTVWDSISAYSTYFALYEWSGAVDDLLDYPTYRAMWRQEINDYRAYWYAYYGYGVYLPDTPPMHYADDYSQRFVWMYWLDPVDTLLIVTDGQLHTQYVLDFDRPLPDWIEPCIS